MKKYRVHKITDWFRIIGGVAASVDYVRECGGSACLFGKMINGKYRSIRIGGHV